MRANWTETTLGKTVAIIRDRLDPASCDPAEMLCHWSIPALDETGGPVTVPASQIGSHKFRVTKNAVVFSLLNPRLPRYVLIQGGENVVCSTEFAVMQPKTGMDESFLYVLASSSEFQKIVGTFASGTTKSRERVRPAELEHIQIRLPPLDVQKRIVNVTAAVDAYIAALHQQADDARAARNAVLHELLTAGGDGWTETTLGQIAGLVMGKTPPRNDKKYWTNELTNPFCTIADMEGKWIHPQREGITPTAIQSLKARKVTAGSLMMSFKLTIGRVGFAGVDLYPNEAIVAIDVDANASTKEYLYLVLGSQDLTHGSGRAIKGATLNSASLSAIPLALPPLSEQQRIVEIVFAMDDVISATEKAVSDAHELRSGLLSVLLSGEHEIPETYDRLLGAA